MTISTAERELVDREFRPGELPVADPATSVTGEPIGSDTEGEGRPSLAAWLALGSLALIFMLIALSAAVNLANGALGGSVLDGLYLVALVGLVGSLGWLLVRQTQTLRRLKSAERARALAVQLAKLDGAGSGLRLLAALRTVYAEQPAILGRLNAVAVALQPHHSDRDVIDLLNREIFEAMDKEAEQRIHRAALRAARMANSTAVLIAAVVEARNSDRLMTRTRLRRLWRRP